VDALSRLQQRVAQGARLHHLKLFPRAPGHVVCKGGVILTLELEQAEQQRRDKDNQTGK
jgi:hypothetical protein